MQITWFLDWKADLDFRPLALETAYGDNASQLLYDAPPETLLARLLLLVRPKRLTQWKAQGQLQRRRCRLAQKEYTACVEGIRLIYLGRNL